MKKFDLITSPAAKRFFKKIKDKELVEKFKTALTEIQLNPYQAGELKKGDLAGIFGYDVYHKGTNYEIAYTIQEDENGNLVIIILAGTREQFYKELKRYIKSTNLKK
jgi:mRNA interferase RelE/StbE